MSERNFKRNVTAKSFAAIFFLTASSLGGASVPSARGQSAPTAIANAKDYAKAEEHARAVAKEWLARGIPGLSVAVAVDGRIVYSAGFGDADLEQRVAAWPTTEFRIGRMVKLLTPVGLLQLV